VLSRRGASEPGRLRLQLELQKATATPDGAGGSTLAWATVATIAADMQPVKAGEHEVGEGLSDLTLQRIVIRHRSDVVAGDRFRLGERLFRIVGVTDPEEDGRYLVCLAEEERGP
jgi:SPP1 family predicted phage head-tail adaptor